MKQAKRSRIDKLLTERGLTSTRARAQALIMARRVFCGGKLIDKAGTQVSKDCEITITEDLPFVSRGGLKLEGLLDSEGIDVKGLRAVDVGSSTGGFTDCLLKKGAARVICIDVGKGLLDWNLRNDSRVVCLEGVNVRNIALGDIGEEVDIAVVDVSFISLKKILKQVSSLVKGGGEISRAYQAAVRGRQRRGRQRRHC